MSQQWTSTPPTEPGWYWATTYEGDTRAVELMVFQGALGIYHVDNNDECEWSALPTEWLWWPIPLQPPEGP